MRNSLRLRAYVICLGVILGATARPVRATGPVSEFPLTNPNSYPWGITAGPDGNVWFCEYSSQKIGRIAPDGLITEFDVHVPPIGIVAGPDGNLWFAAADLDFGTEGEIGRVSPSGEVTEFPTTALPCSIVAGPDGNLWFTNCGPSVAPAGIGRSSTGGVVSSVALPPGHWTYGITVGPDGAIWFTEPSTRQIGRVTTTGSVTEFALPADLVPNSIAAGPDGNVWFTDQFNKINRITTGGDLKRFELAAAYVARGSDGNLWFVDNNTITRLVIADDGVDAGQAFPVPTGNAGVAAVAAEPGGDLWFTESTGNKIGRIDLSADCEPGTLCLGDRFEISVVWAGAGSSGNGRPLPLTANAGAFSFFDPANLEVFVKVLNACPTSGTFTLYVNGLTHLGVTVTVKDRRTGTSKTFVHPDGTEFSLLFDGSTFACP